MPSWFRILLRPLPLLAVGCALFLLTVVLGETIVVVQNVSEWASPLRELAWLGLGLAALGGGWLVWLEIRSYLSLQRIGKLKRALVAEGLKPAAVSRDIRRWLADLERVHGEPLAEALSATRADLAGQQSVANLRSSLEECLLPELDLRVEREIRHSALRLGVASSLFTMPLVDGLLTLGFSLRLVRRVAELHGGRPGVAGTSRLLFEVFVAALGADLSQHASDALSAKVGSLAAAAGQGLVSATLLVRVGLWAQAVCRPVDRERSSVGAFVARGAAQGIKKSVRGGVHRAMRILRQENP